VPPNAEPTRPLASIRKLGVKYRRRVPPSRSATPELESLLASLRPEIESQVKPQLHGLFGRIVRGYLPQVWAFRTEEESASLTVGDDGAVRVTPGVARRHDVLVSWSQKQLTAALRTRDRSKIPGGAAPTVEFNSRKGKRAFSFLRSRFGL